MILGFLHAFCVVAVPSLRLPTKIETYFDCTSDGYYAVPGECSGNYFICVGGVAYEMTCPGNSIFDPILLVCVTPETASCTTTTAISSTTYEPTDPTYPYTEPSTPPTYPSTEPSTPPTYPSTEPATKPTYPSTEPPTTETTPTSTTEPPSTETPTTLPTEPPTTFPSTQTTGTPGTGPTSAPFVCPEPDGDFANPDDCGSFYQCSNGYPILSYCQPPLVFNPAFDQCDYYYNVPGCLPSTGPPTSVSPMI